MLTTKGREKKGAPNEKKVSLFIFSIFFFTQYHLFLGCAITPCVSNKVINFQTKYLVRQKGPKTNLFTAKGCWENFQGITTTHLHGEILRSDTELPIKVPAGDAAARPVSV